MRARAGESAWLARAHVTTASAAPVNALKTGATCASAPSTR